MNVVEYQYHKNDDEEASICTSHSALTVKQSNIKASTYTRSIITSKNKRKMSENLNNNAAGLHFATFEDFVAEFPSVSIALYRDEFGRPFTGDAVQMNMIRFIRRLVEEASNLRDDQEVVERFNSSFQRPVDAVRENNVNADSSDLTSNDDQSVQNQGHRNSRSGNVARMPQESSTASANASNEGSGASKTDNSIDVSALAQAYGNSDASTDVGGEPDQLPSSNPSAAVSVNLSESSAASAAANTNARAGNDNDATSSEERKPPPSKKQKK